MFFIEMNFKTSMNNAKTVHTEIIAQVTVRSACNMCIIRRMRPVPRKYDCVHMADCYYCKYAYKYASEITYGLACFAEIRNKKTLKIMSVGCGPCTELAAVDYLKEKGVLNYEKLQYRGIDH